VEAATPPTSVLHPLFEWNDRAAAHRYRVEQARHVLSDLAVTVVTKEGEVLEVRRAFVNVISRDREQGYVTVIRAASDAYLSRQVLAQAVAELNAWKRRYAEFRELADVFAVIDATIPTVEAIISQDELQPEPA
jgi:hypothetical protein